VHECRWTQTASGAAGQANVGLCPASSFVFGEWRWQMSGLVTGAVLLRSIKQALAACTLARTPTGLLRCVVHRRNKPRD